MPDRKTDIAAIGLGGNIGNPRRTMARALKLLDGREDIKIRTVSPLYRTPPWGDERRAVVGNHA